MPGPSRLSFDLFLLIGRFPVVSEITMGPCLFCLVTLLGKRLRNDLYLSGVLRLGVSGVLRQLALHSVLHSWEPWVLAHSLSFVSLLWLSFF